MPYKLGGYIMEFEAVRRLMMKLDIPDKEVDDDRLEWPINDWLAKNGMLHILAAAIIVPGTESKIENAIMLISSYEYKFHTAEEPSPVLVEGDRDQKVRKWLVEVGGAKEKELRWMVIWDFYDIARNGLQPMTNDMKGPSEPVKEISFQEMMERLRAAPPLNIPGTP